MTFFAIVGIVVCVMVTLFMLTIFLVVWKVRRSFRQLADMVENGLPITSLATPARVHLQPREKITWLDEEKANALLQGLWRLGFQDAGSYEISEMPGVKLRALARPEENLWALVYEHPQAGTWMDVTTRYANGGALTITNTPHGSELQQRPLYDKIFAPELDAEGLYHRHLSERPQNVEFAPVVPENFASEFEKAYAEEMDWRLSRGITTDDELRAMAANSGQELTDEELQTLRQSYEMQTSIALTDAIRERFLEQTPLSAAEWEKLRHRIVIVHDRMPPESVVAEFESWSFDEEMEPDDDEAETTPLYPPDMTPRQKIADFTEPVPASVYRAAPTALSPCDA